MKRAAVIILNYNMREAADRWVETIKKRVTFPHDLIVVDNGSDKLEPSQFTTLRLERNVRTTGGMRLGIEYADMRGLTEYGERPGYYWLLTTSTELAYCAVDPLQTLVEAMESKPDAVSIAPAYDSTVLAWTHRIYQWHGGEGLQQIPSIPFGLISSDFYHEIGGFDQRLTHSWGLEHDLAFTADRMGRTSWLHNDVRLKVNEYVGYTMGRMDMSREQREVEARAEMDKVLTEKYGAMWKWIQERKSYDGIIRCNGN